MQVYTKILIGMAVGAVIGLTLGPNSAFLSKDIYKVQDASTLGLFREADVGSTKVALPSGVSLRLHVLETKTGSVQDSVGNSIEAPVWSRVRFRFSRALGLRDKTGALRTALGDPKPGAWVEVWLQMKSIPLRGGGVATFPEAVSGLGDIIITWISPIGTLFMRLIKMVIVPLVFSSLLVGVASLGDIRKLGRLGGKTLGLYLGTTAVSVTIGLICAHVINPGGFMSEASKARLQAQFQGMAGARVDQAAQAPSMIDNVLSIIPSNPVDSLASGNMLQIIFFAVIFGVALTVAKPERAEPVISFFDRIQEAMVIIINMVMAVAPFGVAALVAKVVGTSGASVLGSLLIYGLTVILGLFLHASGVYLGLVRVLARLPIIDFLRAIRPAQLIAFSTSSSSAALPVSMECAEKKLGVSNGVSSFVLPLGSTINMDGTALYQGVGAIFIAQVFQVDLSLGAQLSIVATATMASVGAAGVPGTGIITLAMVLTASGIPAVGVALVLGMDRILDMFRTAVNVTGDLAVTTIMASSEGETPRLQSSEA